MTINIGTIDSTALDGLYFATELTEHIRVKSDTDEETGEEFSKFFPSLIWTVRDHVSNKSINCLFTRSRTDFYMNNIVRSSWT